MESGAATVVFVPCANTAQLSAQYQIQGGDVAENTFYVLDNNPWDPASLTGLCNTYIAWEATTTLGQLPKAARSAQCSLIAVSARDLTTEFGLRVDVSPVGGPIVGTAAGNPLNPGLSFAVKAVTGHIGRSFRGRTFWIGATIAMTTADGTAWLSANAAGVVTMYENLRNAIHTFSNDLQLVVASRYSGKDPGTGRPAPRDHGVMTPIIGHAVTDAFIDFQRRRQIAHARHR